MLYGRHMSLFTKNGEKVMLYFAHDAFIRINALVIMMKTETAVVQQYGV